MVVVGVGVAAAAGQAVLSSMACGPNVSNNAGPVVGVPGAFKVRGRRLSCIRWADVFLNDNAKTDADWDTVCSGSKVEPGNVFNPNTAP